MTEAELAARFAALANPLDDSDWLDVRRRARRTRRGFALPVAAAVAVLAVASAFGVYRQVVDFFSAEAAPERIVYEYSRMAAVAKVGLGGPHVVAGETRKVMDVEWRGKPEPFYVAPTEDGGFCYRWATGGSCGRVRPEQRAVGMVVVDGKNGPDHVAGHVIDPDVTRLEVEYEDGQSTEIPVVWVSPPIDAGFYAYDVPEAHELAGHGATELVAYDRDGKEVQRTEFIRNDPRWDTGTDGLPRIADRTRKRTLFDFTAPNGSEWTLVTAPAPEDKLCYAYNGGGGCLSPKFPASIETFHAQGPDICCALPAWVASVELRYEDGDRETLRPVDGFLLYVMPTGHYAPGHRLRQLVFRDAEGTDRAWKGVRTDVKGVYPCKEDEQIDLGYDVHVCP